MTTFTANWSAKPLPARLTLGLALTLALAVAGQYALTAPGVPLAAGLLLYALAGVAFVYLTRQAETAAGPGLPPLVVGAPPAQPARLGLWLTAAVLAGLTILGVLTPGKSAFLARSLVVAWVLSLLVYAGSVLYASGWVAAFNARAWWRVHWRDLALFTAFTLAAFAIRAYDVELHPFAFINDEGEVGKEALRILNGERTDFFDVAWASEPIWAFVPSAVAVALFGHTATAIRLVSVALGALTVGLVYLMGREWFSRFVGVAAAGVLLALPVHLHFSRLGVRNIDDGFLSALTLWLLYRGVRRASAANYLAAGVVVGVGWYTYPGSRLVIGLLVGSLVYLALRRWGGLRRQWRAVLVMAGAFALTLAPIAAYYIKTPDQFFARLNTEGVLSNGYLAQQAANGQNLLAVLGYQFSRSSLVYISQAAPSGFYNSPAPYLVPLAAILAVLGLAYTIGRLGDPRYMTLFAWFWAVVILGSTLTMGPPSNQRLLMTTPAVALLVAVGLERLAYLFVHSRLAAPRLVGWVSLGLVAAIAAQGFYFYFGPYRQGHYFEDPSNEFSYAVASAAAARGPDSRVFLLGDPSVFADFGDFGYLAAGVEITDYNTVTRASLAALPRDKDAMFVAIPTRVDDLRRLQQWLPGGEWREVPRRYYPDELSYLTYSVSAAALAQP